jgi:hypothetical protein
VPDAPNQETIDRLTGVLPGASTEMLYVAFSGSGEKGFVMAPPISVGGKWRAFNMSVPDNPWVELEDPTGAIHGAAWDHIMGLSVDVGFGKDGLAVEPEAA